MNKAVFWIGSMALLAAAVTLALRSVFVGLVAAVDTRGLPDVLTGYAACLMLGAVTAVSLVSLGRQLAGTAAPRERRAPFAMVTQPPDRPLSLPAPNVFIRNVIDPETSEPVQGFEFRVSSGGVLEARTIPAHYLRRFFECETPRRKEWKGTKETYTDLLAIARHYQWVRVRTDGTPGYIWATGWESPQRRLGRVAMLTGDG